MGGYFYFFSFIALGMLISFRIFPEFKRVIRLWIGGLFGLLGLMWLVIPIAFYAEFSIASHLIALGLMGLICGLVFIFTLRKKRGFIVADDFDTRILWTVIPLSCFFFFLFYTHYLLPGKEGLYCGGNAYGDLPFHLGIITSLKEQGHFPPQYSIFPGIRLGYPFLVDSLSSSLYLCGTSLRWSIVLPSTALMVLLVSGFMIFAHAVLRKRTPTIIATLLFFINGGLGFFYYLPGKFSQILSEIVNSPTHLFDDNIIWSNLVCDLLIPQRTTLGGWAFLLLALWGLHRAIETSQKKYFFLSGLVAGLLPMIHTHSFLAYVVVALVWLLVYYRKSDDKKNYFINWFALAFPGLILSIPQVLYWTVPQSVSGGYLRVMPGWANQGDIWPLFWLKNTGLFFVLVLFALFSRRNRLRSFYLPAIVLFIMAELIVFQPWAWDNIKIFFVWYLFSVILVADYLDGVIGKITKKSLRRGFLGIIVGICILSGTFSLIREAFSSFLLFSNTDVETAEYIRVHTPRDAVFLSSDFHNNPVSALAGRNIVMGYEGWLWSHGINYEERATDVQVLFSGTDNFSGLAAQYQIDYIYLSSREKAKYKIDGKFFLKYFPIFYHNQDIVILSVSERARKQNKTD